MTATLKLLSDYPGISVIFMLTSIHCIILFSHLLLDSFYKSLFLKSLFIYLFIYLFIHERHTERGRDTSRGRSRLHAGSLTWDLILGLQDQALGQRQHQTAEPPGLPTPGTFSARNTYTGVCFSGYDLCLSLSSQRTESSDWISFGLLHFPVC